MTTEITIRNLPTFANKDLNKATQKIYNISENLRKSALETAYIVAQVEESECYLDDGFATVHEWVERTFGLKKSASYTLLKVGREYVIPVVNAKGKVTGYSTNISGQPEVADYGISQLEKMLPAGHDLAKRLDDIGEINPYMTCKDIEEVIKNNTKQKEEEETETAEAESEETTEAENDECITVVDEAGNDECITVVDEAGNSYYVPISILENYKV